MADPGFPVQEVLTPNRRAPSPNAALGNFACQNEQNKTLEEGAYVGAAPEICHWLPTATAAVWRWSTNIVHRSISTYLL